MVVSAATAPGPEQLLEFAQRLDAVDEVVLPDWNFFYAREGDRLSDIDAMFGLPKGSVRTVGRVHHPDPDRPYAGEAIAVPVPGFAVRPAAAERARSPRA